MFRFMDIIRPDYKEIVGEYDYGDWFFLLAGIFVPILLIDIVYNIISYGILVGTGASPFWVLKEWGYILVAIASVLIGVLALCAAWCRAKRVETERLEVLQVAQNER
jgi:hypothetical protein